jgi:membrane protein implicated in regulation of membrane protease activity
MDIIHYFSQHHDQAFYLIAGISFVIELTIMGLGGPLLFFAIASFLCGVLISFGAISGWEMEMFATGILTGLTAVILWRPLKNFQNSGGGPDTSSDMIGQQVPTSSEITATSGTIRHSGINWNARLSNDSSVTSIPTDTPCIIAFVEGNVMIVKPLEGS